MLGCVAHPDRSQWLTDDAIAECHGADIAEHNENLFDANVKPYTDMSLKGWCVTQRLSSRLTGSKTACLLRG